MSVPFLSGAPLGMPCLGAPRSLAPFSGCGDPQPGPSGRGRELRGAPGTGSPARRGGVGAEGLW